MIFSITEKFTHLISLFSFEVNSEVPQRNMPLTKVHNIPSLFESHLNQPNKINSYPLARNHFSCEEFKRLYERINGDELPNQNGLVEKITRYIQLFNTDGESDCYRNLGDELYPFITTCMAIKKNMLNFRLFMDYDLFFSFLNEKWEGKESCIVRYRRHTVNIEIEKRENKISLIVFDPLKESLIPQNLPYDLKKIEKFNKTYQVGYTVNFLGIQKSRLDCKFFTLSSLIQINKNRKIIEEQHKVNFAKLNNTQDVIVSTEPGRLPANFFKHYQSRELINMLHPDIRQSVVNKKGETLEMRRKRFEKIVNGRVRSHSIEYSIDRWLKEALAWACLLTDQ